IVCTRTSWNPAWIKDCFKASELARAKGPGVPAGGAGALISFLTIEKARSSIGTLAGIDHTAAAKLPLGLRSCLIVLKATGRCGRNIKPHRERTQSNDEFGKSKFSASVTRNSIAPSNPTNL